MAAAAVVTPRRLRRLVAGAELRAELVAAVEPVGRHRTLTLFVLAAFHDAEDVAGTPRGKRYGAILRAARI
jgi:hypothetical protein